MFSRIKSVGRFQKVGKISVFRLTINLMRWVPTPHNNGLAKIGLTEPAHRLLEFCWTLVFWPFEIKKCEKVWPSRAIGILLPNLRQALSVSGHYRVFILKVFRNTKCRKSKNIFGWLVDWFQKGNGLNVSHFDQTFVLTVENYQRFGLTHTLVN